MAAHNRNVIVICPAEHKAAVIAICQGLGHTERELDKPLYAPGNPDPVAWVSSPWTTLGYAKMLTEAPAAPDEIEEGDDTLYMPLPADTLAWLRATLTISVNPPLDLEGVSYPTPRAHFDAVIAAAGLVEVATEEGI